MRGVKSRNFVTVLSKMGPTGFDSERIRQVSR